jgi:hypothetical protein
MIEPLLQNDHAPRKRMRHDVLFTGIYTGSLLIIVMLAGLVAANRMPGLERYALERNAASYSLFVLFTTIPVLRFWNQPLKMFGAAILGWSLFVIAFDISGMVFRDLFDAVRHDPLMAFVEGAVVYGICAAISWVGEMILHARKHPIEPGRKPASESTRYRR